MQSSLKRRNTLRAVYAFLLFLNCVPAFWGLYLFVPKFMAAAPGPLALALFLPYIALVLTALIGGSIGLWWMVCGSRPALVPCLVKDN